MNGSEESDDFEGLTRSRDWKRETKKKTRLFLRVAVPNILGYSAARVLEDEQEIERLTCLLNEIVF